MITHGHHDHCHPETFKKLLDENTEIIAPKSCSDPINRDFTAVEPGETIKISGIEDEQDERTIRTLSSPKGKR